MAFDRRDPTDDEKRALEAVKSRPDLPKAWVDNAWKVGPSAVLALCLGQPTPEEFDAQEQAKQRDLRLAECRRQAARAFEARECLDGRWGDATRRDVAIILGDLRAQVLLLAAWAEAEMRGVITVPDNWREVRRAAETTAVIDVLVNTNKLVRQAEAESHVPKKRRRPKSGGYTARSKG
jgi:hypothetical protein